eukprot:TRINITY_DN10609_c0_g1_i1.p1 TRINITY_DN10609_c0_g1~~TRINITY_DN10609_c0_g1_i1.p1  ORF type:complete len:210 (+),score=61.06 TRINITY_DN10609_c0_g1_i1:399-1028(+)
MKKRSHTCIGGAEEKMEEESPFKKRKKIFKPLTVMILDCYGPSQQHYLELIKRKGESNVDVELKFAHFQDTVTTQTKYAIFVEAVKIGTSGENIYIGQLSEGYKELVKSAIEDRSFVKAELAELKKAIHPDTQQPCWFPQLNIFRDSSWRTKRLCEVEYMVFSGEGKRKNREKVWCGGGYCHCPSPPIFTITTSKNLTTTNDPLLIFSP